MVSRCSLSEGDVFTLHLVDVSRCVHLSYFTFLVNHVEGFV